MAKFEVFDTIPSEYKQSYLGEGTHGDCYLTSYGDVYKEFKGSFPYDTELGMTSEIVLPSFAFPTKLVYLGKKDPSALKGYRMDRVIGKKFCDLDPKTKIEVLLDAARGVEKDILELVKYHAIVLYDLNNANVLFQNNDTFRVIDTDLYYWMPSEETYDNLKQSMMEWNEYLLYNMKGGRQAFYSEKLNNYHEIALTNGKYRASSVIEEVLDEIRVNTGIEPTTLEEYNESVKLIKRKEYL